MSVHGFEASIDVSETKLPLKVRTFPSAVEVWLLC